MSTINKYWNREAGFKDLLTIAIPLIISTAAWSIQHFVDRMFLAWYSTDAIAAAMPAAMFNFTIMCLFLGTAGYVNTFVAQYFGAGENGKIGAVIWQGMYIAIISGIVLVLFYPFAEQIFRVIGHKPEVQHQEVIYFRILCFGAFPVVGSSVLSCFYSGRGKTWFLMYVTLISTLINIVLDYLLIFGNFGFAEMGIRGAGIATLIAGTVPFVIYFFSIRFKKYRTEYNILRDWKFDLKLFSRIIYFGFPNGIQFFLDIAGFSIFIFLIGRLGTVELAASNIALNINNLVFMPMIGIGLSISIMVGQYLGANKEELAERITYSGLFLSLFYILPYIISFLTFPDFFVNIFGTHGNSENFEEVREISIILLKFIAFYSFFDILNLIFAGTLKGAGDTRFVMYLIFSVSLLVLVIPSFIVLLVLKKGIFAGWFLVAAYILILGLGFFIRFKGGKWKKIRVIPIKTPSLPSNYADTPTLDI